MGYAHPPAYQREGPVSTRNLQGAGHNPSQLDRVCDIFPRMAQIRKSLEALMRDHTDTAVETVVDLMDSEDPKVRLAAAREVLDRRQRNPTGVTVMLPGNQQQRQRLAAMPDEAQMDVINSDFEPLP